METTIVTQFMATFLGIKVLVEMLIYAYLLFLSKKVGLQPSTVDFIKMLCVFLLMDTLCLMFILR